MRCYACDEYFEPDGDCLDDEYCNKCSLIIVDSIEEKNDKDRKANY